MNELYQGEKNTTEDNSRKIMRLPKNIRQVGMPAMDERIYIEDYVVTFLRQLYYESEEKNILIMMGNKDNVEGNDCIFVNGLIKTDILLSGINEKITLDIWEEINYKREKYFPEIDILGLCIACCEWDEEDDNIIKVQKDNFAIEENLCLIYEYFDREENFYKIKNNELIKEKGFFIYYERNEKMQNYMLDEKGSKSIEYGYHDDTTEKIKRAVNRSSVAYPSKNETKKISRVKYSNYKRGVSHTNNHVKKNKKQQFTLNNNPQKKINLKQVPTMIVLVVILTLSAGKIGDIKNATTTKAEQALIKAEGLAKNYIDEEDNKLEIESVSGEVSKAIETPKPTEDIVLQNSSQVTSEPVVAEIDEVVLETPMPTISAPVVSNNIQASITNQVETKVNPSKTYIVQKGDALVDISRKMYGTINMVNKIIEANNIENENKIFIGQELIIP